MSLDRFIRIDSRKARIGMGIACVMLASWFFLTAALKGGIDPAPLPYGFPLVLILNLAILIAFKRLNLFYMLIGGSLMLFPFLLQQYTLFDGLARRFADIPLLQILCSNICGISFIGALFICPSLFLIGIIGGWINYLVSSMKWRGGKSG